MNDNPCQCETVGEHGGRTPPTFNEISIIVQECRKGEWYGVTNEQWTSQDGVDLSNMDRKQRCTPDAGILAVLELIEGRDKVIKEVAYAHTMVAPGATTFTLYQLHPDHVTWHDEEVL